MWEPEFFGAKPDLVVKGGMINSAVNGDANGSIKTSEPLKYRKMYGQFGGNITHSAMTFVSNTAYEIELCLVGSEMCIRDSVKTDHGNEIGIRLKQPIDLQYGDILYQDDTNMIIVDVNSEDLLVIKPRSLKEMGDIAHQLGNRHLPAQFTETEMLIQYDYLVEDLLKELGIPYSHEDRKVNQAFRHIGHSHD